MNGEEKLNEGKYIVFRDGTAKVFSLNDIHSFMAGSHEVLSAGRFEIREGGRVHCFGESTTLGVKSYPEDADIIAPYLSDSVHTQSQEYKSLESAFYEASDMADASIIKSFIRDNFISKAEVTKALETTIDNNQNPQTIVALRDFLVALHISEE